jgi:sRNA-binding carbon storage regulator CsrA
LQFHHKKHPQKHTNHTYTFDYILFLFLFFSFLFFTSTIQNTNSKQLNKNYIKITIIAPKQSGIYKEHLLHHQNSVRQTSRAARQWRRVGSRAAARNSTGRGDLERLPPPLAFLVGSDLYKQQNRNN